MQSDNEKWTKHRYVSVRDSPVEFEKYKKKEQIIPARWKKRTKQNVFKHKFPGIIKQIEVILLLRCVWVCEIGDFL